MKKCNLVVLVLILILFAACQPQTRAARMPTPPSATAPESRAQPSTKPDEYPQQAAVEQSTALIRELTLNAATSLPDALLNTTRCFVLALPRRTQVLSSCRTEAAPSDWSTPEQMSLRTAQPLNAVFLIMVLSRRGAAAISSGQLNLADIKTVAGKALSQASLLTQHDLGYDAVTYSYADGRLAGAPLVGTIRRTAPAQRTDTPGGGSVERSEPAPLASEYVKWVKSYFNAITPTGIIIHHSAIMPESGKAPRKVSEVDEYHAQRGMDIECLGREYHVAYHYLIFPNGSVKPGRPERCEGAHARGYNSFVGISLVGDFSSADNPNGRKGQMKPTAKQMKSLIRLTEELRKKYNIPVQRVLRHSDVASTMCPGDRFAFKTFLASLEQPRPK